MNVRIVIGVALFMIAIAAFWYFWPREAKEPAPAFTATTTETAALHGATVAIPADWKTYRHERYKLSFRYPPNLTVNEIDEGGGATTIVFQDPVAGEGFQLFSVPFEGRYVTQERFARDVPSGIVGNPRNVLVCGAPGTTFTSADSTLGETHEVWFIQNRRLFEATTFLVLKDFTERILATCQPLEGNTP